MKSQVEEIISYKCNYCSSIFEDKFEADRCALEDAKVNLANTMLNKGFTFDYIEYCCGFHWNLSEEQKKITKDNCFIFSHWQCCNRPAYKIVGIEKGGFLKLWGVGGWHGGYGDVISLDDLPEPHSKEELYSYK